MIKRKYIVAGNYNEYINYIKNKETNIEYIYVHNIKTLMGLTNIEGYYIGTYNSRKDIDDIKAMIDMVKKYPSIEIDNNYWNPAYDNDIFNQSMLDSMRDK